MNFKEHIRVIRDVPEEGFVVYDTSTLLLDSLAWRHAINGLAKVVTQYQPDRRSPTSLAWASSRCTGRDGWPGA